jgi:PhnB protein
MQLELFINFDGNCREAVEFYAKVFRSEVRNLMTYADAPPDPNYAVPEADRERIMYAGVPIGGMTVMCMDMPSCEPLVVGNNITPTFSTDSKDEVVRLFNELKEGGRVYMEPQQAFFSELYCTVEDKFGVIWQILHYVPQA